MLAVLAAGGALPAAGAAVASDPVKVLVLRENSVGSSAQAQPYLDEFLAAASRANGWTAWQGKYTTRREQAVTYIENEKPHFGILSLGAFLAVSKQYRLEVIGQVGVSAGGGRRYLVVSTTEGGLGACRGQTLASDHLDDTRFVESVIARGAFRVGDFVPVSTSRPVQTLKKVIRGEARCALIDDAQWSSTSGVEGGGTLKVVWKSGELPPMPVVAFPEAGAARIDSFKKSLPGLCKGDGKEICRKVGIVSLTSASEASYTELVKAYSR